MKKSISPSIIQSKLIEDALKRRHSSIMNNTTQVEERSSIFDTSVINSDISKNMRNSMQNDDLEIPTNNQEREKTPVRMITPKKVALRELNSRIELKRISRNVENAIIPQMHKVIKTKEEAKKALVAKMNNEYSLKRKSIADIVLSPDYQEKLGNRKSSLCSSNKKALEERKNQSAQTQSQKYSKNSSQLGKKKNVSVMKLDNYEITEVSAFEIDSNEYRTASFPADDPKEKDIKPSKKHNRNKSFIGNNSMLKKNPNVSMRSSIKTQRQRQNSLLDTSLELNLNENNPKNMNKHLKGKSSCSNSKILSRAISSIHSRSSSVVLRSTFHTLNEGQGTPFSQIDENKSFSNLSTSVMNKRRNTNVSVCKSENKRKPVRANTIKTEPNATKKVLKIGNIDNKLLQKLNQCVSKITANTFTVIYLTFILVF